jgi:putative transposase
VFLKVLEQTRQKYQFVVAGYVVMPEHVHLLISEPNIEDPSRVMQVLKQRVSLQCRARKTAANIFSEQLSAAFWQPRSYDFNVRTEKKYVEKLNYIHSNPVKRGLVGSPELWPWSSFRHYWLGEEGPVKVGG